MTAEKAKPVEDGKMLSSNKGMFQKAILRRRACVLPVPTAY
jgi:hypothetical protein